MVVEVRRIKYSEGANEKRMAHRALTFSPLPAQNCTKCVNVPVTDDVN
jgi:hypothetical protein